MPRQLLKRLVPDPQALRQRWFLRPFGARLADPQLWTLHRRAVTYAFAAGLAICFIPLPVHMLTAGTVAILFRLNIPVVVGTTFLVNPLTVWPAYYGAYRLGAALLHEPHHAFHFVLSWEWLRTGLAPLWRPLLLGCLVCALVCSLCGWLALELLWRYQVLRRYRARHALPAR
ncbi:MAG: DUF2062 domain-containing protein [Gammaproteobacteria bacterium]|nr:DUF2062 domain-containing protein [Gammaproteobacteria bacterium]